MTSRDWDFIIGDFGDPLADIELWMLPPHPQWIVDESTREGIANGKRQTRSGSRT